LDVLYCHIQSYFYNELTLFFLDKTCVLSPGCFKSFRNEFLKVDTGPKKINLKDTEDEVMAWLVLADSQKLLFLIEARHQFRNFGRVLSLAGSILTPTPWSGCQDLDNFSCITAQINE